MNYQREYAIKNYAKKISGDNDRGIIRYLFVFIFFTLTLFVIPRLNLHDIVKPYIVSHMNIEPSDFNNLYLIFVFALNAVLALLILRRDFIESARTTPAGFIRNVLYVVMGYGMILLLSFIVKFSGLPEIPVSQNQQNVNGILNSGLAIAFMLTIIISAPIIEEVVFRLIIVGRFKDVLPPVLMAIISALVFAAAHYSIGDPIFALVPYVFVGGAAATMYIISGYNIWVPICIHMVNNLMATL